MKLMFASDLHGSVNWTKQVIEKFKAEEADYLVLLGDLLYHGPRNPIAKDYNPQEVAKLLNDHKQYLVAVRGNCDSEVDQMVLEFPMTADYNVLPLKDRKVFATHGHLYDETTLPKFLVAGDVFIFGHIHIPVLKEENGIYIFNPGSVSLPKEGHPSTYAIMENQTYTVKTFDGATYQQMQL